MDNRKLWLFTIAMLLGNFTASAHDFEVGGIYYNITSSSDLTVAVTYGGSYYNSYSNEYSGAVTIPSTVSYNSETYSVTSIRGAAFCDCSSLTTINIPGSVTSIGNEAFRGCSSLTVITIPESVTSIGNWAFSECCSLTSIILSEGVTSIGDYAFYNCNGLTSIILPEGVTSIGESTFRGCCNLTSITLPEGVTSIGWYAFEDCSSLASITLPKDVASIGSSAFHNCGSLKTVINYSDLIIQRGSSDYGYVGYYADKVFNLDEFMDGYAFKTTDGVYYMTGYIGEDTELTLPKNYRGENYQIGARAFHSYSSLTAITLPEGITSIGNYAFYGCSSLTSIILPEDVTNIGSYAFSGCCSLTSITIPEAMTSIGNYAFDNCAALKEVVIEDGCETLSLGYNYYYSSGVGEGLFYDCPLESVYLGRNLSYNSGSSYGCSPFYSKTKLTSVVIGEGVTSIGNSAFNHCSSLKTVINYSGLNIQRGSSNYGYVGYYADRVINIDEVIDGYAFRTIDGVHYMTGYVGEDTELALPENYRGENYQIGNDAFRGCSSLTSITIPEGVTSIEDGAFEGCTALKEVVIEDGSETLTLGYNNYYSYATGEGLFYDCPLESVYLGRNLSYSSGKSYGYSPFYNKDALNQVIIGDEVTTITDYAFYGCDNIPSFTIHSGVLAIGSNAFSTPDKVIWMTNTPPTGYANAKGNINYVSNNQYTNLNNVQIYPYLSSMFEVGGVKYVPVNPSVRTCHAIDCAYDSTATVINVSESVSFKGVAMKVTEVMSYTFYENNYIKEVAVSHLGSLGDYAFYGCSSLQTVTLGDSIGSLGNKVFCQCTSLREIMIPDSVKTIGEYCFSGCSSMKTAVIGDGVTTISNYAFQNCSSLPEISMPQTITTIGNYVFSGCSKLADVIIENRSTALNLGSNGSSALFADCPLDSVYIGGKITYNTTSSKGYSPFYRNTSLRTVLITDREEQVYENEFYGCTNLQNVTIGNGVKAIGNYAFSGCSSLEGFSFGSSMEAIGVEAFSDCTNLSTITSHATVPPTCGTQALDDINKWNCTLRVPIGYATAYQAAEQWKEFFFVEDVVEVTTYVLTYMVDGVVYHTEALAHKAPITAIAEPTKEGHTFSGWGEVPAAMPAQDITIYGTFAINKYMVSFVVDGVVMAANELEYGSAITVPTMPEREGYTFSGWGEVAETVPAHDVTYEACYTANIYKVYYFVGATLVHTAEVAYGEAIPEYVYEPTAEGDVFLGWIGETYETMPAHDVTYTANITNDVLQWTIDNGQLTIYDLSGRKVTDTENLKGGIYIVNGRKVVINNK